MVIVFGFSLCFGLISIASHDEAVLGNLVLIPFLTDFLLAIYKKP